MNKRNKQKWKAVNANSGVDKKHFNYFMDSLKFKKKVVIILHVLFKSRRGCLFLSCIDRGMHLYAAHDYAFKTSISNVADMLDKHGWDIAFGKLQ